MCFVGGSSILNTCNIKYQNFILLLSLTVEQNWKSSTANVTLSTYFWYQKDSEVSENGLTLKMEK